MVQDKKKKLKPKEKNFLNKYNIKWVIAISMGTFIMAIVFSIISESIMRNVEITVAFITLLVIVFIGVTFDAIGIAVAAANEKPFHAMAANSIPEGKYGSRLVRNASPVSNFCNDVIGDICGIISGAAGTIIVLKLVNIYGFSQGTVLSIVFSSFIAALTVGGKAFGKEIALKNSREIVFYTAKVVMLLDMKLGINVIPEMKRKKK
ncbi:hypothetical protein [Clostridiisalibacter paucivorans]|uniref:hypothetical protein n=1 Tax=Clostridiisalibacter paucivorans TaxID=408753 RepID=UPI000A4AABD0|nr:hypothetical protein [Clostridiisalibacter paucivorans]